MSLVIEDESSENYKYDHHSALETEMLFTGYIKENYKGYIPVVLIRLCCQFFEQILFWTLKGKQLELFLNAKKEDKLRIDSKIITWSPIEFQFHLFPNKSWLAQDGFVGFCWRIHSIPKWIKKVHIEYKMYCIDSLCVGKDRIILNNNDMDINKIGHGWDLNIMKFPEKYPLKSMTFACFIQCKYNENAKDDCDTIKNNNYVPLPDDGYRKIMDRINYKIKL